VNQLVILALNVIDPPVGFNDPVPPMSTNPWNLIGMNSAGSPSVDYMQFIYWHQVSAAEALVPPSFTFDFTEGMPAMPATVRATGVAIIYRDTCTESTPTACSTGTPVGNPILDATSGTANASTTVDEISAINVLTNGLVTCAFGTSNTTNGFNTAPTLPTPLTFQNGNSGTNGGLALYARFEPMMGMDGPWIATLDGGVSGDNAAQCISIIPIGF